MRPLRSCYAHSLLRAPGAISRAILQVQKRHRSSQTTASCQLLLAPYPRGRSPHFLRASMSSPSQTKPRFSAGSDELALSEKLQTLLASPDGGGEAASGPGGRWELTPSGEGLERSFKFKTFAKTWNFMTAVAQLCKTMNHHPEWSNVYNTTFIRWTTHSPRGLSAQDVELASLCDGLAGDFGEVIPEESSGTNSCDTGRQLADTVASKAGDCCVPKPKGE